LLKYHTSFDRYFQVPAAERPARMRADFEALLASRQEEAQRTRSAPGYVVMYTHPCRTVTAVFPSNFTAGKNPPRAEWQPAPLRPQSEVDALVRDFDAFLGWIEELRAQGQVVLTGYRDFYARFQEPAEARLQIHHVMELARALAVDNAPLTPRRVAGRWLSPAEQLGLVARALAHATAWNELPKELPLRRPLGPIDGEDAQPGTAPIRGQVSLGAVQRAAQAADEACAHGAIPAQVELPSVANGVGPGRALRAMARGLVVWNSGAHHDTTLTLPAGGDETAFSQRDDFQKLRFQQTWSIFPPDFTGERLLVQARWQTWTAKPA
jgi:hypothetical protein